MNTTAVKQHAGHISDVGLGSIRSEGATSLPAVERLRRLAGLERGDISVVVVYAVAIGLVSLAVPIAAQSLVNTVAFTAMLQPIVVLSALVLLGLIAAGVLRTLQYKVVETLQQRFFVRTTHDAVHRLIRADVRAFAEQGAPEVMNRFFDVAIVQKAASTLLLDGLSVVLQGAVSLVLLAFYHPALLAYDVVLIVLITTKTLQNSTSADRRVVLAPGPRHRRTSGPWRMACHHRATHTRAIGGGGVGRDGRARGRREVRQIPRDLLRFGCVARQGRGDRGPSVRTRRGHRLCPAGIEDILRTASSCASR